MISDLIVQMVLTLSWGFIFWILSYMLKRISWVYRSLIWFSNVWLLYGVGYSHFEQRPPRFKPEYMMEITGSYLRILFKIGKNEFRDCVKNKTVYDEVINYVNSHRDDYPTEFYLMPRIIESWEKVFRSIS